MLMIVWSLIFLFAIGGFEIVKKTTLNRVTKMEFKTQSLLSFIGRLRFVLVPSLAIGILELLKKLIVNKLLKVITLSGMTHFAGGLGSMSCEA